MTPSVNLLPQREQKSNHIILLVLVSILCAVLIGMFFYSETGSLKNETQENNDKTVEYQNKVAELNKGKGDPAVDQEIVKLRDLVAKLEENPRDTASLLSNATELLPQNGYLITVQYNQKSNSLNITGNFPSLVESSYYLTRLLQSSWVVDAKLNNAVSNTQKSIQETTAVSDDTYIASYSVQLMNTDQGNKGAVK